MKKRVLCLLANGVEETELVAPVDILRRAGVEVVMASLTGGNTVRGKHGIAIGADALLEEVDPAEFDLLLLPGGPAVFWLREDGRAADLARSFAQGSKPVAAICAAPLLLHDAGLLEGLRHTAHSSVYQELRDADPGTRVAADGGIITSRGAGTAIEFGLELARQLAGPAKAAEVAVAIMA